MNKVIKEAVRIIATELAKEELEVSYVIHNQEVVDETRTQKVWMTEILNNHHYGEDFVVSPDIDKIQQAIFDQMVKQFKKLIRDDIKSGQ